MLWGKAQFIKSSSEDSQQMHVSAIHFPYIFTESPTSTSSGEGNQ